MLERHIHVVQPYWVGTKDRKSLALIIPAQIAKERNLNASTVFVLKVDNTKIVLQVINAEHEDEETAMIPVGRVSRLPASRYHLSEINSPWWTT